MDLFLLLLVLVPLAAIGVLVWSVVTIRALQRRLEALELRLAASGAAAGHAPVAGHTEPATLGDGREAAPSDMGAGLFERFVGGKLLIWVGGAALVLAAVFLIRHSIEIGLITPLMRMIAAALFGLALVGAGEAARTGRGWLDDPRAAQALVGAGLAVLYATVYGSHILYGFLSLSVAGALMVALTAAALTLSLRHGAPTAALGLAGGYLTPWLVGDPDAGALPLLLYLALLDAAVFAIAYRRGWTWAAALAVLASFAWTAVLLFGPVADAMAAGWFVLGLGLVAGFGTRGRLAVAWVQPLGIAAAQLALLVVRDDLGLLAWLQFAAVAAASLLLGQRTAAARPTPLLILTLGVLLLAAKRALGDEAALGPAAAGLTLLFGAGGFALARAQREAWWVMLSAAGWAGPALMLRAVAPDLLAPTAWGVTLVALAAGPLLLGRAVRLTGGGALAGSIAVLPALAAALLLAVALGDLLHEDLLTLGWAALASGFILAGLRLPDRALRFAGLILLTAAVCKLFLIDAAALSGVLRILSFLGLGAALIGLGRVLGPVLRAGEREGVVSANHRSG